MGVSLEATSQAGPANGAAAPTPIYGLFPAW